MSSTTTLLQSNLGIGQVSTGNPSLDGSGSILCFTPSLVNGGVPGIFGGGAIITSITIKAITSTTSQGMVRLFIYNGSNYYLLKEIPVPPTTQSAVLPTFSYVLPLNLNLSLNDSIYATTQNSDTFNVFVNGFNYGSINPNNNMNVNQIMNAANTGNVQISIANSNLNGVGSSLLLNAISSGTNVGTAVKSITVKAQETTTQGMVRLFTFDGSNFWLWTEIPIPAITQSSVVPTYGVTVPVCLSLNATYDIYASTQNGQIFDLTADANNFTCVIPS